MWWRGAWGRSSGKKVKAEVEVEAKGKAKIRPRLRLKLVLEETRNEDRGSILNDIREYDAPIPPPHRRGRPFPPLLRGALLREYKGQIAPNTLFTLFFY